jgi:exodeoxyribonuclease V beta subunit
VFSHEDKYYVADYKFNSLGDTLEAYSEVSLKAAMLSKRYDLQMVLYLLSLHRLLKSRIKDYDYDKHVGGGVYWFLRGSEHKSTHGLVFERPPKKLIVALEALFMGASR